MFNGNGNGDVSVCRACMKTSNTNDLINLFIHEWDFDGFETVAELFSKYTFLKVDDDEQFMPYICNDCYVLLMNFHEFRKMCIASNYELLKLKLSCSECVVTLNRMDCSDAGDEAVFFDAQSESTEGDGSSGSMFHQTMTSQPVEATIPVSTHRPGPKSKRNSLLICPVCRFEAKHPSILKRHLNLHTKQFKFICEFCQRVFYQHSSLLQHRRYTHYCCKVRNGYRCRLCEQTFDNRDMFVEHAETLHAGKDLCIGRSIGFRYLQFLFPSSFPERFLKCKVCFEIEKDLTALNAHKALHTKKILTTSQTIANDKSVVDHHQSGANSQTCSNNEIIRPGSSNEDANSLVCDICGVATKNENLLTQHMATYHRRQYLCEFCATICISNVSLESHRNQAHYINKVDDIYSCALCDENFFSSDDIIQHMLVHSAGKTKLSIYLLTEHHADCRAAMNRD